MGLAGPVGFEPGMFKKEGEAKHKSDPTKVFNLNVMCFYHKDET